MLKLFFNRKTFALLITFTLVTAIQPSFAMGADGPSVSVNNAFDIKQRSAVVSVGITCDNTLYTPQSTYLYYSATNRNPKQGDTVIRCDNGGSLTFSRLAPNTKYYYSVVFNYRNKRTGVTATIKSVPKSFTTLPSPGTKAVEEPSVSVNPAFNIRQNSANVTVAADYDSSLYTPLSVDLYYSKNSSPGSNDTKLTKQTDGDFVLSGLAANTRYYYVAILNYKNINTSVTGMTKSATHSFTTRQTPVVNTSVSSATYVDAESATVSFSYAVSNCTVNEYGVKIDGDVGFSVVDSQSENTLNKTISNLTLNDTYVVTAYVIYDDSSGITQTKDSVPFNYKHADPAPAAVEPSVTTDSAVFDATHGNITLTATVTNAGSADVTDKGFVYSYTNATPAIGGTNCTKYQVNGTIVANDRSAYSGAITTDTSKEQCYVRAYAVSSVDTVYGSVITVPLPGTSAVTVTDIRNITSDSATADITVMSAGNGITHSGVVYSTSTSYLTKGSAYSQYKEAVNTVTGSSSYDLTGLNANTYNYVKAYVINKGGTLTYAPDYTAFSTSAGTSLPNVTTVSTGNVTNTTADVTINVTSSGGYSITQRGVVYSDTNRMPTIYDDIKTVSGTTGRTTLTLTGLTSNKTYYVRAFAKNSQGVAYGEERAFTTDYSYYRGAPTVSTSTVSNVTAYTAEADINVTSAGDSRVTDRGVVYSASNSNPRDGYSGCYKESVSGTTGRTTVKLSNLKPDTRYYVRAYATNSYGTNLGTVKEITTNKNYVTTSSVTNISGSSATVEGVVSSNSNNIIERGVVYSSSDTVPTISSNRINAYSSSRSYSVTLTGLMTNTKYYIRAYIRTNNGYQYGDVRSFTTLGEVTLTVLYKTVDGTQAGTQTLHPARGMPVRTDSLNLPFGYELLSPFYNITVSGNETVTVYVKRPSTGVYMEGYFDNTFRPDANITRLEVAKMIYALRGSGGAVIGKTFTDIPANFAGKPAIDYVSAMNVMTGFPDGSFQPYGNITRAEIAAVCNNAYKLEPADISNPFSDTMNHWGRDYIKNAYKNGIINGYLDGTYKPDRSMTRAEAATLFARAEKRELQPLGSEQFADVPKNHWAYYYIMNAAIAFNR